MPLEKFGCW